MNNYLQNLGIMKYKLGSKHTEVFFTDNFKFLFQKSIKRAYIIDELIFDLYKDKLQNIYCDLPIYFLKAKEENKSLTEAKEIYNFFQKNNVNRTSIITGIGGGITTDITAFTASTYMRGCKLILIPTTFLAMIDASIGGKTSINYNYIKNNIGTFYPAEKIIIIPEFLKTLPEEEMKNGWAECIKVALIKRSSLFDMLKSKINIKDIIEKAVELKVEICEEDLEDRGDRRLLNLGHTFAHVLESVSNYELSHGTAVSVGIRAAALFSLQKELIDSISYKKINNLLDIFELPAVIPLSYKAKLKEIGYRVLIQDKKADDFLNLVLFKDFNEVFIFPCKDKSQIIETLLNFLG